MLGTSPSPISFLGAIRASLVDAWIPVFFAACAISFCNLSNWAWMRSGLIQDRQKNKLRRVVIIFQITRLKQLPIFYGLGVKSNLCSNSLCNLLKASLVVELEGPARALSWRNKHTLVEVGCGLQVVPRLLFQLLTELLPLYRSNVRCTVGREINCKTLKQDLKLKCER